MKAPRSSCGLDAFEGFLNQPRYQLRSDDAHGQADRVDFLDETRAVVRNASLTTCSRQPGPSWLPDWVLRAASIQIDTEEDVGAARGGAEFHAGAAAWPAPILEFSLSDQRKSGLLPPTPGLDNVNGIELSVPYYWNIAPNRDATLTPTFMSKRSVNLSTEFRYLEADYNGELRWEPDAGRPAAQPHTLGSGSTGTAARWHVPGGDGQHDAGPVVEPGQRRRLLARFHPRQAAP
jgi:LPS-assembly protein